MGHGWQSEQEGKCEIVYVVEIECAHGWTNWNFFIGIGDLAPSASEVQCHHSKCLQKHIG